MRRDATLRSKRGPGVNGLDRDVEACALRGQHRVWPMVTTKPYADATP
jgi:hypothetical protein